MKIKKPEDEKYFKDIVLNDILEEISSETGASKPSELKKITASKKRIFSKSLFFMIIAVLFFFFVLVLLYLVTDATKETKYTSQTPTQSIAKTEEWKMPEDREVKNKKPIVEKEVDTKPTKINTVKPKPQPKPKQKTERELAKEALRQQMLQ